MKTRFNFRRVGFSLVEVMISMAILTLLLVMMSTMIRVTCSMWSNTRGKIEQFREARDGFESMVRRISHATLNTYWDYEDAAGNTRSSGSNGNNFTPARYARQSELRFLCGPSTSLLKDWESHPTHAIFFQAPLGIVGDTSGDYGVLEYLLNTCGYCIQYGDDADSRPPFVNVPPRNRFRLMELIQPAEEMTLYQYTTGASTYSGKDWYLDAFASKPQPVHEVAENIIALVFLPKLATNEDSTGTKLAPNYLYDSTVKAADPVINPKNQLPPVVQVTMVAIDETSAKRMTEQDNQEMQMELNRHFSKASDFDADLRRTARSDGSLEDYLIKKKINYRIFNTSISIKGSKWSRGQKN